MRTLSVALLFLAACTGTVPPAGPGDAGDAGQQAADAGDGGASADGGTDAGVKDAGLTPEQVAILAARPWRVVVPSGYDGGFEVPLVVLLHGYSATGFEQDTYFQFSQLANAKTFVLATPDGLIDSSGQHYWNATNACCDLNASGVDDVKYLTALIDDAALRFRIDPKRVFFVGHSNGAFMSHRMACDRAERVAAIVSLAGANWEDLTRCQPANPVSVLQVHGTLDAVISYDGGTMGVPAQRYPAARATVQGWAQFNGCSGGLGDGGAPLDLDTVLFGNETRREAYRCDAGAAELWTIEAGTHVPAFGSGWGDAVWSFLSAHPHQ